MKGSLGTLQIRFVSYNIHCFSDNFLYTTNKNTTERFVDYMFIESILQHVFLLYLSVYILFKLSISTFFLVFFAFYSFFVFFMFYMLLYAISLFTWVYGQSFAFKRKESCLCKRDRNLYLLSWLVFLSIRPLCLVVF